MSDFIFSIPPLVFIVVIVIVWSVVVLLFNKIITTTEDLKEINGGVQLKSSGWGSGKINGMSATNCLKVVEFENGYLFRTMWIFGNEKLWLPKEIPYVSIENNNGSFFIPSNKVITWNNNKVVLYGKLSEAFTQ